MQWATAAGAAALLPGFSRAADYAKTTSHSLAGRLYKTLKIKMIKVEGTLTDKFLAAKEAGFMGVEMNSPGMEVEPTRRAIRESGISVDGTVCSTHWKIRHSSPDAAIRAQALQDLETALRDTSAVGWSHRSSGTRQRGRWAGRRHLGTIDQQYKKSPSSRS